MHAYTAPHQKHAYKLSRKATSYLGRASQSPSSKNISQNPLPQVWVTIVTNRKISRQQNKSIQPFPYHNLPMSLLPSNLTILAPTPCTPAWHLNLIYVKHIPIREEKYLCSLPVVITTCLSSTTMIQTPSCQYH